jgi:hypothetical protein
VREHRAPDVVTISKSGCTALNHEVIMTGTKSENQPLTCS